MRVLSPLKYAFEWQDAFESLLVSPASEAMLNRSTHALVGKLRANLTSTKMARLVCLPTAAAPTYISPLK